MLLGAPAAGLMGVGGVASAQSTVHDLCGYCHNVHGGGGSVPLTDYNRDIDLCLSCHGDAAPDSAFGEAVPKGVDVHFGPKHGADTTTCVECHDHEGSVGSNLKLIASTVTTPNSGDRTVVFTSRGTDAGQGSANSFADGDGTYDGICEVCHTTTDMHRNSSAGVHTHAEGRTCTTCHRHDGNALPDTTGGFDGFAPLDTTCAGCHTTAQAPRRRAILPEFSRASHHAPDPPDTTDCNVCHDQTLHAQGTVRLKNVDNGADTIVLGGDPATDPTWADSLTRFCLACHDPAGSGPAQPFSDLQTPPTIDSTAWVASSHNAGGRSCFGDGTSGCHATGHGSEKRKLGALNAGTAPTAPAQEEEGICFNCHDSNGPSSIDMQSLFSQTVGWVTEAVRAGGDTTSLRNDRHDVQDSIQATSGAQIECTDCHDPHTATSALPYRLDPDATDGRQPGTGQVRSGADTLTEFCLDCHDGSLPTGVSEPAGTGYLTNIMQTDSSDGMGMGAGNANLMTGIGWADSDTMPCFACHEVHVSPDFFHGLDTLKAKDGTPLPWYDISKQGDTLQTVWNYSITDNSLNNSLINGYYWCNACHDQSMGDNKTNCFACHFHGTRW